MTETMKIRRSYLARIVQVYEGPANEIELDEYESVASYGDADEMIFGTGNWSLISDQVELLDDDDLTLEIIN